MIGYGVVGSGYFGAELARIMNTKPGAVIRAVHDPENGAAVAAELGCDAEGSLKALVSRKDIQAVIVATPNYLHKEPVLAAAAHGLNVFCEKPIALSYGDCREMVRACQDNHVIFMAGHVMNFFRGVRRAKELIGQGAIGDILYCHGARNAWEGTGASETWKKTRSKSGGHLYHHIHELDCVQFLMGGCPDTVTMAGGNAAHREDAYGDEDDMLFITMEYPDNRYAVLLIRGAGPVMDLKYDLMKHPAVRQTSLAGGPPYIHHGQNQASVISGHELFAAFSTDDANEEKENAA